MIKMTDNMGSMKNILEWPNILKVPIILINIEEYACT